MSAKVVSIINLKGGVGKSTLTMMLGEFLSFRFSQMFFSLTWTLRPT